MANWKKKVNVKSVIDSFRPEVLLEEVTDTEEGEY